MAFGWDKVGKGIGRHRGEERGMMLVCYLAGSGDRTLKEMYSVPAPNLKFGKWQERPLKRFSSYIGIALLTTMGGLDMALHLNYSLGCLVDDLWASEMTISNFSPADR
ncbi:hypothetical protein Tco_0490815 [Tanacetum coccineum]